MSVCLHAIGKRMPDWVQTGVLEYTRRLPRHWRFEMHEHTHARGGSAQQRKMREARTLLAALPGDAHRVALDGRGKLWSTEQLAGEAERWQALGKPVVLLIGGADGLDQTLLDSAAQRWSLSPLTFPHPLARLIVAEQLYRAHSLLQNHPYHRG